MRKILALSIAVVLVIGLVAGGTWAYFSDTEEATGNTFTAGTIDIAVNGENPWEGEGYFTIDDMKPCDVEYIDFTITNVGENEVDVWKHLDIDENYAEPGGVMTEPECDAEGGAWTCDAAGANCTCVDNTPVDDIASVIAYDLIVDGEVIIDEEDGVTMAAIDCCWIYLGKIEPGESMEVTQSYHMSAEAGNEYQGDVVSFKIELFAQQIRGCPPPPDPECTTYGKPSGTYVDIGDPLSERGHLNRDVDDWSYVGAFDKDAPGYLPHDSYGGYDGGSADFRGLMGAPTGCVDHYYATFVMNACPGPVTTLTLRHLDGQVDDSFDVEILIDGVWTNIGHYTAGQYGGVETWVTTSYELPEPMTGKLEFRLIATEPANDWCATWGQVMFNWARVD